MERPYPSGDPEWDAYHAAAETEPGRTERHRHSVSQERRRLLGKHVRVMMGRAVIVEGVLLGFGEDGDYEIQSDDGALHFAWPMLSVEEI
jgi:hypothetical protein